MTDPMKGRHRFDCASCVSTVDPEGEHPRIGWPHRCYVCAKRRWWPTHWLWRWRLIHLPKHTGYDVDHPLVVCPDCGAEYTACDLGNHYCPSCGESCEAAEPAVCKGCPCVESGGDCCWCGVEIEDGHP